MPSVKSIVAPAPAYVAELRRRIERGLGASAVARQAGMSRMTLWKLLSKPEESTIEVADRVRQALAELEPHGDVLPPVVVAVADAAQYRWIEAGALLREKDPDAFDKALRQVERDALKKR